MEAGTDTASRHSHLDSYDATDVAESSYRSLNPLAVVGLLLGLASPLLYFAPLLTVLPVLAIGVCAVALGQIAKTPEYLTGRGMALVGMTLAVAVLCSYHVSGLLEKRLLSAQAEPYALEWIELVRNSQVEQAYQLTLDARSRAAIEAAEKRGEPSTVISSEEFASQSAVKALTQVGSAGKVRHRYDGALMRQKRGNLQLSQMYDVQSSDGQTVEVALLMQRTAGREGAPAVWRVINVDLPGS